MWFCTWIIGAIGIAHAQLDLDSATVEEFAALENIYH